MANYHAGYNEDDSEGIGDLCEHPALQAIAALTAKHGEECAQVHAGNLHPSRVMTDEHTLCLAYNAVYDALRRAQQQE